MPPVNWPIILGATASLLLCSIVSWGQQPSNESASHQRHAVIPQPSMMKAGEGHFTFIPGTTIVHGMGAKPEAEYMAEVFEPAMGFRLAVDELAVGEPPPAGRVVLKLDASAQSLGDEGYRLRVSPEGVLATAYRPAGLFYSVQTMRQLLPPDVYTSQPVEGMAWTIPSVEIEDVPRFPWRGQLFDCCRHFFDVETVKRAIDLLAMHKMNRLHWHITEDQGWRLEIQRYPKLTEVGGFRTQRDGSRYGGFYTREDVREVVEYAARRHIVVVPEIEMPGHAMAALASYPELGCTGGPYTVPHTWGIFRDVFCAGNDATLIFVKNVLDEVLDLFPSQYIHIGGDECPKDRWKECDRCQARIKSEGLADEYELQSWFITQVDAYLAGRGRRLVGWDEILEGGLAPGAVVQSWRGVGGGIEAASAGHDVIMSPTSHCYLDYSYTSISVEKAYSFEPVPGDLPTERAHHVLGLEGNMWTERVPNRDRLDYQVYPRLTALSEVAWSPKELRDWEGFQQRLETQLARFDIIGVKYGKDDQSDAIAGAATFAQWTPDQMSEDGVVLEWDVTPLITSPGRYEFVFLYRRGACAIEIHWAALLEDGQEVSRDTHEGWSGADKRDIVYRLNVSEVKPGARYTLSARVYSMGGTDSTGDVMWRKAP